jgi:ATP-binding cassette subfamily B protein
VSQDTFLFNDTIKYNICYGHDGKVKERDFNRIIRRTFIDGFVQRLPKKYDTIIGERGARLSGGQKQKIAIARALLKNPEILIMDEATSALDANTENIIGQVINTLAKAKTIIVIAHRFSTIKNADKIVYLSGGRVAESGTLDELINKNGLFAHQWQAQKL